MNDSMDHRMLESPLLENTSISKSEEAGYQSLEDKSTHDDQSRENKSSLGDLDLEAGQVNGEISLAPKVQIISTDNLQIISTHNLKGLHMDTLASDPSEEIRKFQSSMFWMGLDQSSRGATVFSWIIFFLLTLFVPLLSACIVECSKCGDQHTNSFEHIVQVSESALASVSFFLLSYILRTYGLENLLFVDNFARDSSEVRLGYEKELHRAFRMLATILLPCFLLESIHKIWWFRYATVKILGLENDIFKNTIMCSAVLVAWLYKTSTFLFMCVLFWLLCSHQILRLQSFLQIKPDIAKILSEHMRIRKQLLTISHRFRSFLVASLIIITLSQFTSLFLITSSSEVVNLFRAGNLAVCAAVQLTGFLICLHGAAKITHRAQRVVSVVSQWHAIMTCTSHIDCSSTLITWDSDKEDNSFTCQPSEHADYDKHKSSDTYFFQKRQALVAYLQHCSAGISLYGFLLDRGFIYAVSSIELSLALFILGTTVGIR